MKWEISEIRALKHYYLLKKITLRVIFMSTMETLHHQFEWQKMHYWISSWFAQARVTSDWRIPRYGVQSEIENVEDCGSPWKNIWRVRFNSTRWVSRLLSMDHNCTPVTTSKERFTLFNSNLDEFLHYFKTDSLQHTKTKQNRNLIFPKANRSRGRPKWACQPTKKWLQLLP